MTGIGRGSPDGEGAHDGVRAIGDGGHMGWKNTADGHIVVEGGPLKGMYCRAT